MLLTLSAVLNAAKLPEGFILEKLADRLNPVAMTIDPFGRIWIIEKQGNVLIFEQGNPLPHSFIEINVDDYNERGLLGIALHPDFIINGYVYLYYTVPFQAKNRLSRFTANGDAASPDSEIILLETEELNGTVHNGGAMVFDDNGYLYIATGEGGKGTNAQDFTNLHGKILRLNDNGDIPEDNPFFTLLEGKTRAIWATGLRNPFSMFYDPHNHVLYVSDVGQGEFEEVNVILKGKNYGWPVVEGPQNQIISGDFVDPLHYYNHENGCAIVGAAVNLSEHNKFPVAYRDVFFYADYCEGSINYFMLNNPEKAIQFASGIDRPLAIAFSELGAMYLLTRSGIGGGSSADNTKTTDGALWRISYTGSGRPFILEDLEDQLVPLGENVKFSLEALGNDPLRYLWYLNDSLQKDSNEPFFDLTIVQETLDGSLIQCLVINSEGADTSSIAILNVTQKQRPKVYIDKPLQGSLYQALDTIFFSGYALDDDRIMDSASLIWSVNQHHNDHFHPVIESRCCTQNGYFVIPSIGETSPNVWYKVHLRGIGPEGLESLSTVEIFPDYTAIVVNGKSGLKVNIDGMRYQLPDTITSLIGIERILVAPSPQIIGDSMFLFNHWENSDTLSTRFIETPMDTIKLGVNYQGFQLGDGNGLLGSYFIDPEFDLDGTPVLERVDSVISFNWGNKSPLNTVLPNDNFTVSWDGFIQSIMPGEYQFVVFSDDGARLWIDDQLIIDEWHPQSAKNLIGKILLKAEKKYKIRLEYQEATGGSIVELKWGTKHFSEQIIPKRQLYTPLALASVRGEIWLDENRNGFYDLDEKPVANLPVILYKNLPASIVDFTHTDISGQYELSGIDSGTYFLKFENLLIKPDWENGIGIQKNGFTPLFRLNPGDSKIINVTLVPVKADENVSDQKVTKVYPNPFTDQIHIDVHETVNRIIITDFTSRVVHIVSYQPNKIISLADLVPGMYVLTLEYEEKKERIKILRL